MRRGFGTHAERSVVQYQNELAARHLDEVRNLYREMRAWKHDVHSHMQTMKAYLAAGEYALLDAYIDKLDGDLTAVDTVVKSGNAAVDAVLNSKLSLAVHKGAAVNVRAAVPEQIAPEDTDVCVLLGNLLDNAIESCMQVAGLGKSPFIRVFLGMKKRNLYISVTNSAVRQADPIGKRFATTKPGFHGYGLARVDRVVEKYGGVIIRASEEDGFTTEILLPV